MAGRFGRRDDEDAPIIPGTNMRRPPQDPIFRPPDQQPQAPQGPINPNKQQQFQNAAPTPNSSIGSSGSSGAPVVQQQTGTGVSSNSNVAKTPEELAYEAMQELLRGGVRDTSADEAQIQEMLRSTVGQGQADLNARMGAGGFGTSGALGAVSGDMRRMAARDAAMDIMGIRDDARDDRRSDLQLGLQSNFTDRGFDMSEEQWAQYIEAINAMNYDPNQIGAIGPNGMNGDINGDGKLSNIEKEVWERHHPEGAPAAEDDTPFSYPSVDNPEDYEEWTSPIPLVASIVGEDADYYYLKGFDGKLWKSKVGKF